IGTPGGTWPYTSDELTTRTGPLKRACRAASSRCCVPPAFAANVPTGSSNERAADACPARWITAETPVPVSSRLCAGSCPTATSHCTQRSTAASPASTAGGAGSSPAPQTASPRARSARTTCGPTKPPTPVMRIVIAEIAGAPCPGSHRHARGLRAAPVVEHVGERLLERDHGLPARGLREAAVIAQKDG